jgi:integrase
MASELLPILTDTERDALARVLRTSSRYPTGRRNAAMLTLALHCGLRVSEIVGHEKREGGGLRLRDVDLTTGKLTLRDTKDTRTRKAKKTKAGREVWLPPAALYELRAYWADRAFGPDAPESYFFLTRTGKRVPNREIRAAYSRYAERAGIPLEKRHPHALRHSCATELAGRVPLHVVQRILGHSNLAATQKYLHATGDDIRIAMQGGGL